MTYDPLIDLINAAEEACATCGLISKANALKNPQTVLRKNPVISLQLQRGMATELRQRIVVRYSLSGGNGYQTSSQRISLQPT
jgi:hypothetical protein